MKAMKKLASVILAVCLVFPVMPVVVNAAEGELMFSDPETKVGENVSVDLVINAAGAPIGDADVTMSYDTSALEFVSGSGVQADGAGKLTYFGSGTGSETELRTTMEFRALKAGDAQITVDSYTAYLYSDETLNLTEGSSAISIAAADDGSTSVEASSPSGTAAATDIKVTVDGTEYSFSEAFTSADIPDGYSEVKLMFNGEERKFVENEAGLCLGYLVDASGVGSFFLYNEEDATFSVYVELPISDTTSLVLLNEPEAVSLPDSYVQRDLELTGVSQVFPTWVDTQGNERFYIVYALNTRTGEKGLYQYDTEDGTYQSFEAPQVVEEDTDNSFLGKLKNFVADHFLLVMAAGAVVVLLLFILVIVLAVKVVHRNQELDDLYDEYDIPVDDEEEDSVGKAGEESEEGYDDYDEEYDDYDNDFDDEYDDDDYEEYDDEYEEEVKPKGRKKEKAKGNSKDDYDIDFIDL